MIPTEEKVGTWSRVGMLKARMSLRNRGEEEVHEAGGQRPGLRRQQPATRLEKNTREPRNLQIPTFFSGYHVDPLLRKEVFALKNQAF